MYTVNKISNWDLRVNIETNKPCELYVDRLPSNEKHNLRILWVAELNEVSGVRNNIIQRHNEFDLILTWDHEILEKCKNSKLFPFGTSWILDFDFNKEKEYCVTSLIGGKKLSENHLVRQRLPEKLLNIKSIPIHLFNSSNNPYSSGTINRNMQDRDRKNELFYSQFHIAIENFSHLNFFTEKLIDCFQTKTIPIYIGCPNIGDFYDVRGMFIVNNIEEIIDVCNNLTLDTYSSMLQYVEKNYELSHPHAKFRERLHDEVINFVNTYKH
jgi:hypothetical protein